MSIALAVSTMSSTRAETDVLRRLDELGATVTMDHGDAVGLKIDCTDLTDADYGLIASLKSLKSISIDGKPLLDHHLQILSQLSDLQAFQINGTMLTDDGYRHFAALKNLRRLSLFHPSRDVEEFTGSGLAHLKTLPNLKQLTFAGATAGDEALKAVGQLTQIEEFRQWHNWDSPDGIKHLAGLDNLRTLKVGQRLPNWSTVRPASLDDATIPVIASMNSLETVDLQEARLTYAGLIRLKSLPKLKTIKLKWVDIPESDIVKLKRELPDVTIDWVPLSAKDEQDLLVKKLKL
ncbi:leucine-rich repeat domain-containing protein [Rubripirellula amarantea]|nr:hypothetical protein [Rubripirellula amarantea]